MASDTPDTTPERMPYHQTLDGPVQTYTALYRTDIPVTGDPQLAIARATLQLTCDGPVTNLLAVDVFADDATSDGYCVQCDFTSRAPPDTFEQAVVITEPTT